MSYEISVKQYDKLQERVAAWIVRADLSHITLHRVSVIDGEDADEPLNSLDKDLINTLGTPTDVLEHLIEPSFLAAPGALQIAANFLTKDGSKLEQRKRRRMKVKLQKEGINTQRENAKERSGADNLADTVAESLRDERERTGSLLDRFFDGSNDHTVTLMSLHETMRAGDLAHHTETLKLHTERIEAETKLTLELWKAENAGLFNDFLKLPESIQKMITEKGFAFLNSWNDERKADKALKRQVQRLELETAQLDLEQKRLAIAAPGDKREEVDSGASSESRVASSDGGVIEVESNPVIPPAPSPEAVEAP